jgi:outer membrane protein assembly factor BamB
MRSRKLAIVIWVFMVFPAATSLLSAQDWPQWRGPGRDGKVTGFAVPATWPAQFTQKWKVTVGAGADSTPALAGDKLYVLARQGGDEVILCLDAATGKELWRNQYPVPAVTGPSARDHSGPRSSPAVANGKVVTIGVTGIVSCLDAATGRLVWRKDDYPGGYPVYYTGTSPLLIDGMAIVQIGAPANGGIVAYDLNSGEPKWKWTGDGPGYGSPVVANLAGTRQVVTLTDKLIVGVALADGRLLWQVSYPVQGMGYNAATPIIDGQKVYISGQRRGTKAFQIEKQGDAFAAKELWANAQLGVQFNTPVLKDGFLYGLSDNGMYFCLNAATGEATWTDSVRRRNYCAIEDVGPVLIGLTQDGTMTVFQPDEKAFTQVAAIKVDETQTYAHPILAGKRIFVRDVDSLILWVIE